MEDNKEESLEKKQLSTWSYVIESSMRNWNKKKSYRKYLVRNGKERQECGGLGSV